MKTIDIFLIFAQNINCGYKNEEDPFKNEGTRVVTTFILVVSLHAFFRRSREANSTVRSPILSKFELIRAFIVVLATYKNEEDPIKNERTRVLSRL